jgi:integrase
VFGPYRRGSKWRVIVLAANGRQRPRSFESEAEAQEYAQAVKEEMACAPQRTVDVGITEYEDYMKFEKGNKERSAEETVRRLRLFFPKGALLSSITPKKGQHLYDEFRERKNRKGETVSVDYHRNMLEEAKTFMRWCVGKKWMRENPLEAVKGVGRRKHGKPQPRIDEARKWFAKALELADKGDKGAIAAMTTLLMAPRCSEIVERVVRDLDDQGRVLWIDESKTDAGRRFLKVPDVLQPYLLKLCEGKGPTDYIFASKRKGSRGYKVKTADQQPSRDWPRRQVKRICRLVGIPEFCAHAMRGAHATFAEEAGCTGDLVAAQLGHTSVTITHESYTKPAAVAGARQNRVLKIMQGGRK